MDRIAVTLYFATLAEATAYTSKCPPLPAGASVAAAPAAAAPAAGGLTMEQMQAKLKALMDTKGKDVVVKIFAEMNAKKLSDIKAEQYAILDAKIGTAMAAETNLFG
jgi:hypothetical protein